MKRWAGCVKADFGRMFQGWGFWASVLLILLVQYLSVMDTWAFLKELTALDVYDMISSIDSQFQSLVSIIVALPFSAAFAEEVRSRYLYFQLARGDWRAHAASKMLVNALSAGLAMALGIGLFLLFCQIRSDATAIQTPLEPGYWSLDGSDLLINGHPVLFLTANLGLRAIYASVWAMAAMAVSAYIQNLFIILISPEVISYLIGNVESLLNVPLSRRLSYLDGAAFGFAGMGEAYAAALPWVLSMYIFFGALFVFGVRKKVSRGV